MTCDDIRPVLLDYVMEEVAPAERGEIAQHLETCSACSQEAGRFRQTLGTLTQGAAFEDVPQKIRIMAEPINAWAAFWRNPARLAFAASALACMAIAFLALARATVTYDQGKFEIAFGAAATPAPSSATQSPAVAPLPESASVIPASASGLTREQVEELIAAAVVASETRQSSNAARLVQAAAQQADTNRLNDRIEMAESLRYFQAAQVNMWKQQVESQQVMTALVERTGMELPARP
jgi:anti-sigma factor RsiW